MLRAERRRLASSLELPELKWRPHGYSVLTPVSAGPATVRTHPIGQKNVAMHIHVQRTAAGRPF